MVGKVMCPTEALSLKSDNLHGILLMTERLKSHALIYKIISA